MANSKEKIKELLSREGPGIFRRPNMLATGIGYKTVQGKKTGDLCIVCSVESKLPPSSLSSREIIPPAIDGILTDVVQTGPINILAAPTGRFRPSPGGVSIGHTAITAGTLGCIVSREGKNFILSNNHVLANSNNAATGDLILQPGPFDGGTVSNDQLARLSHFITIEFEGNNNRCNFTRAYIGLYNAIARLTGSNSRLFSRNSGSGINLVDCALAEPFSEGDVIDEILMIGKPTGIVTGDLGMPVKKSGRTTGLTQGVIEQTDVTVRVNFGTGRTALFADQLIAGAMSQGGDSGSVVVSQDNDVVGLLFAGSTTTTIINRIENVFRLLDVTLA